MREQGKGAIKATVPGAGIKLVIPGAREQCRSA